MSTKRLTEPRPFTGKNEEAQVWSYKVAAYIKANPTIYADDESKIYLVLGLMEKNRVALKWAESQYTMLANEQAAYDLRVAAATTATPPTPIPPIPAALTWVHFADSFNKRWVPANRTINALSKIANIKQRGSVEDYIADFLTIAYDTGLDNTVLVTFFRNGLNNMTLRTILNSSFTGTTLETWLEKAKEVDTNFQSTKGNIGTKGSFGSKKFSKSRPCQDDAMDVDAIRTKGPKKGVTKEKRERLAKEGKCFQCFGKWEPGHMCEKKKEAQRTFKSGGDSRDKQIRTLQAQITKMKKKESSLEQEETTAAPESSESETPKRKNATVRFMRKGKGRAAPGFGSDSDFGDGL